MAAKLTVVCMLVLLGLACSPPFVEALKCYMCSGNGHQCTGSNEGEVLCLPNHYCSIEKDRGKLAKSCQHVNGTELQKFQCLRRELGQRGNCIRATDVEYTSVANKCGIETSPTSEGKSPSLLSSGRKNTAGDHRAGQPKQCISFAAFYCTTDLCNTQAFLESGQEGGSGTTGQPMSATKQGGSGSGGVTGRLEGAGMTLASGIFAIVSSWFNE